MSRPRLADFVMQTSTSVGSGDYVLDGFLPLPWRPWRSGFPGETEVSYGAMQKGAGAESGIGKLVWSGTGFDLIQRLEVLESSADGAPISWPSGGKTMVYSMRPAKQILLDSVAHYLIRGVRSVPPASGNFGDLWLVGDAPSGAFATHENQLAEDNGIGGWNYILAQEGDLATDNLADATDGIAGGTYEYKGGSNPSGVWVGSDWLYQGQTGLATKGKFKTISANYTLVLADHFSVIECRENLTLKFEPPTADARFGGFICWVVVPDIGKTVTCQVNPAWGGFFAGTGGGTSSFTLTTGESVMVVGLDGITSALDYLVVGKTIT